METEALDRALARVMAAIKRVRISQEARLSVERMDGLIEAMQEALEALEALHELLQAALDEEEETEIFMTRGLGKDIGGCSFCPSQGTIWRLSMPTFPVRFCRRCLGDLFHQAQLLRWRPPSQGDLHYPHGVE